MQTVTEAATVLLVAGCLGLVAGLAAVTWLHRAVLAARPAHRDTLRGIGRRLSGLLLTVGAVTVAAAIVLESRRTAGGLPEAAGPGLRRSLMFVGLGGYLLLAQTLVGLTALARRWPARHQRSGRSHDLGATMVSAASLVTAVFAFGAIAVVAYLHLTIGGEPS